MIKTIDLHVYFKSGGKLVKALKGVNITIGNKEIVGVAGESGSGKTTLGKTVLGLIKPEKGQVLWNDLNVFSLRGKKLKEFRMKNQIIYQDPFDAIDIRFRVYDAIAEGIKINHIAKSKDEEREIVLNALKTVGLNPPQDFAVAYPTQLSGGQLQRVAIARALVLRPEFLVADEPVSMLDVSIRAGILDIFNKIREDYGTSTLLITHDLSTVAYVADRIYILYQGKVVEYGTTAQIVESPKHPYTQSLISAIPIPEPGYKLEVKLIEDSVPIPENGCPLYPRCPFRKEVCKEQDPQMVEVEAGHYVACHLY